MERVLVLDDDPDILNEVSEALTREGYDVVTARDAREMWAATEKQDIDLFILDLMLPGDSGLNLARGIRRKSDVGIIIATGKTEETDRVVGLEIGADDYITKPFSPRELAARVKSVLRRTKGSVYRGSETEPGRAAEIAEFGDWRMDLAAHRLTGPDGEEVALTTAEFELLRTLVESPNRVHSRDHLLDRIHGREWAGYDRGVDGLISRLRRKIESDLDASPYIKTIRGAGYLFAAKVTKK